MTWPRLLMRLLLGSRRPTASGEHRVPGLRADLTIRRDKFGVPTIEAENDHDAYFGVGFVQGQDRGFQLESHLRAARGTMSELVGKVALPLDRVSRRIGFRRAADAQLPALDADVRDAMTAFVAGINAARGLEPRPPHEFHFLKATPTPWEPADVLALAKFQAFLLPSNWDVELARLQILRADGSKAVRELDPVGDASAFVRDTKRGPADVLAEDLLHFTRHFGRGGGSNNWVLAGTRTATGKPILANDPHLAPTLPNPWYLAHVNTPAWAVAGATLVGTPIFSIAHNGFACWGVTAGLTDNTDLFLVKPSDQFPKVREVIRVADGPDEVEEVVVTPHGPAVAGSADELITMRAVWLDPLPVRGFFDAPRAKNFEQFREAFAAWPTMPLNVLYADETGLIGYQLVGQLPKRKVGNGTLPLPAEVGGWDGLVPFHEMPFAVYPDAGFLATANDRTDANAKFGVDYVDPYRAEVIREELTKRSNWDVTVCGELQRNQRSKPWELVREIVLAVPSDNPDAELGLSLLRDWDGHVSATSPAAAVFELLLAEMCERVAKAKAPTAWRAALGGGLDLGPFTNSLFGDRRVGHLVKLLQSNAEELADELHAALTAVVRKLRTTHGPGPAFWQWGDLRQLRLEHPLFKDHWLGRVFNAGPVPVGGDGNTVFQAAAHPLDPLGFTQNVPNLRAVFDVSNWSNSRFALAGGQSGNPCSANFADLFELWQAGGSIPIPWGADEVIRTAVTSLRLRPDG